ncbi:MAG: hypothetical protein ABIE42_05705 [Candidatus Eisenbacteria bacterium]
MTKTNWMKKAHDEREALLRSYPPRAGTAFAIFRPDPDDPSQEIWLHPSTFHPGGWRLTRVDKRPEWAHTPFTGHTEFDTYEAALKELATYERAIFVSRNVEPVMLPPSVGFRNVSTEDLRKQAAQTEHDLEEDRRKWGGSNALLYSTLLFAMKEELRRRGGGMAGVALKAFGGR